MPTVAEFTAALAKIPPASKKMKALLAAHLAAPKLAMTATSLSGKVGYRDFRGFNSAYGHLARKLGQVMRRPKDRIGLIVDFLPPDEVSNQHYIAFLNPKFAKAVGRAKWLE